jgi:hypothetical protein
VLINCITISFFPLFFQHWSCFLDSKGLGQPFNTTGSELYNALHPPPPHRALSGALAGPDSAALRLTMWFCRRVWLFGCGSYLNRKEMKHFITCELMPVVRTALALHDWKVWISNLLGGSRAKNIDNFFCWTEAHVEPSCMVLCITKQGQKKCARRQEKHAPGVFSVWQA